MARASSKTTVNTKKVSKELLRRIKKTLKNVYAPYSGISVSAALYCANGNIYTGCNVENSSYSLTMCAERVALFKAVSEGEKDFLLLLLHSPDIDSILPCGACLQVYSEHSPNIIIATVSTKDEFRFYPIKTLLTQPFRLKK
ncbi:MAG: cytidine deaminase [candidate division WOR-3 bacterium]|nr:MAG: cytidine deaminase [candidate division WOR-3 bacterium]